MRPTDGGQADHQRPPGGEGCANGKIADAARGSGHGARTLVGRLHGCRHLHRRHHGKLPDQHTHAADGIADHHAVGAGIPRIHRREHQVGARGAGEDDAVLLPLVGERCGSLGHDGQRGCRTRGDRLFAHDPDNRRGNTNRIARGDAVARLRTLDVIFRQGIGIADRTVHHRCRPLPRIIRMTQPQHVTEFMQRQALEIIIGTRRAQRSAVGIHGSIAVEQHIALDAMSIRPALNNCQGQANHAAAPGFPINGRAEEDVVDAILFSHGHLRTGHRHKSGARNHRVPFVKRLLRHLVPGCRSVGQLARQRRSIQIQVHRDGS